MFEETMSVVDQRVALPLINLRESRKHDMWGYKYRLQLDNAPLPAVRAASTKLRIIRHRHWKMTLDVTDSLESAV